MRGALLRGWRCPAPRASPFRPPGPRIPTPRRHRSPSRTSTTPRPRSTPRPPTSRRSRARLAAAQQRLESTPGRRGARPPRRSTAPGTKRSRPPRPPGSPRSGRRPRPPISSGSARRTPSRGRGVRVLAAAHRARRDRPGRRHHRGAREHRRAAERRGRTAGPLRRLRRRRHPGRGRRRPGRRGARRCPHRGRTSQGLPATPLATPRPRRPTRPTPYAAERDRLIGQLAQLQGVSAGLAEQRQDQLEAAGRRRSGRGCPAAGQRQAGRGAAAGADPYRSAHPDRRHRRPPRRPRRPRRRPRPPRRRPPRRRPPRPTHADPDHSADPADSAGPATSGDAAAAIAFARAQLGEPYQYGAAGPNSWDCSGLTMMAWQAGGKSLPHYSVAQYQQSTPISLAQLQPGDLLFWGDGGPTSIYHVAIYTGDGMMIHAPGRAGRSRRCPCTTGSPPTTSPGRRPRLDGSVRRGQRHRRTRGRAAGEDSPDDGARARGGRLRPADASTSRR